MAINWKSPYVIGGLGIGAVILFIAVAKGGGSGSGSVQSLQAADSVNTQLAGLATSSNINLTNQNAAIAMTSIQSDTALKGGLMASVFSFMTNGTNNQTALAAKAMDVNSGIVTNGQNNALTMALLPKLQSMKNANDQALAGIDLSKTEFLAPYVLEGMRVNQDTQMGLARTNLEAVTGVAKINANAATSIASTKADAQMVSSGMQMVGSIVGGII